MLSCPQFARAEMLCKSSPRGGKLPLPFCACLLGWETTRDKDKGSEQMPSGKNWSFIPEDQLDGAEID